jgi:MFS family permease
MRNRPRLLAATWDSRYGLPPEVTNSMRKTASQGTQWGNLVAAVAAVACCAIATGLVLQLLPLLLERQGTPAWLIGANAAMGSIGILLAGPLLPRIIGRFGSKTMAFVAVGLLILSLVAFKLFPNIWAWFLVRFVFGIMVGMLFTISEAWVLTFAGEKSRGPIMGFYTSILAISFAVGPLILPFTGIDGWLPWMIGIVCVLLSALPLLTVNVSQIDFKPKDGATYFRFFRRAPILLLAVLAVTLFDNVYISFFTIFGMRSGLPLATSSTILGTAIVCNVFLFTPMGMLADRWSRPGVMMITATLTAVLCLSLPFVVTTWAIWPVMIMTSAVAFGPYIISLATMGDRFSGGELIAGAAAVSAMWGVGGLIGPPIAGAAIDAFGINAMPVTMALFHGALLALLIASRGQLVRDEVRV